jgi:hypothetical protein
VSTRIREETMKAIGIAALLLLATAGAAEAGDWRFVASNSTRVFGYDAGSLRRSGTVVTVWEITVEKDRAAAAGIAGYDYYLVRSRFDCADYTRTMISSSYYLMDSDSPVVSDRFDGQTDDIIPDTVGARSIDAVCADQAGTPGLDTARTFARTARDFLRTDRP